MSRKGQLIAGVQKMFQTLVISNKIVKEIILIFNVFIYAKLQNADSTA